MSNQESRRAQPEGEAPQAEAFAWAVFAENGNVIIWSKKRSEVEAASEKYARPVVPVIAISAAQHAENGARAALASRPAEVDDEGLPALPEGHAMEGHFGENGEWTTVDGYTAEQYRQGQRDAVAADRARRGDGWISVEDRLPEARQIVLVMSEGWEFPAVLKYQESPFQRFLDEVNGRWYWYPERMKWRSLPAAPSHTTNKEK